MRAHYLALKCMRDGGHSLIANCGYGRGYSEVIDAVIRTVGRQFSIRETGPGDAIAVVANSQRTRKELGWVPTYDNLHVIIGHAPQWEETLRKRNRIG